MPEAVQLELALIPHEIENTLILQRAVDGYVNATAMCKAVGKMLGHYLENKTTKDFLTELASDIGMPISGLVIVKKGGISAEQGTWVHPDVAINLGRWCSPKFAVAVSKWVREWITGKSRMGLPYHIQRYMANMSEVPPTHFSILNELIFGLIAPLESRGYTLPDNMVPDISQGKMFCKWLRDVKGIDTDTLPTYRHSYGDGRVVRPKLYPLSVLEEFRQHFHEVWMKKEAPRYFKERSPEALPYLDAVLKALPAPKPTPKLKG